MKGDAATLVFKAARKLGAIENSVIEPASLVEPPEGCKPDFHFGRRQVVHMAIVFAPSRISQGTGHRWERAHV
jgi:hypothetical protein